MSGTIPEYPEDCLEDITRRKTRDCNKYQYEVKGVIFNFYDTPGINDTGGYLEDNENLEKIFRCIQSLDHLTSLIFLLNGTQARLTINIQNVLQRFHQRLPDVFYSNIILILSNCASHTVNFESMELFHNPPIFYMQNSAFSSDARIWSEQTREILQRDWNRSMETMNELIKNLLLFKPISTQAVANINHDRDRLRSTLHESRLMMMELQHIEDELIALEQASQIYSENLEKYSSENPTQTKTIEVNEIIITPYYNTICLNCNIVCHEQCTLSETEQAGEDVFRHCTVMDKGRCTICPERCSYEMHYHDRRLIKRVPRRVKFAISSLTNKYSQAEEEKVACEIKCQTVQEAKHLIEQLLREQLKKIQDACADVRQHCQNFNLAEELMTFTRLFKNEINSLRSPSVIDQAKRFLAQVEILANGGTISISDSQAITRRKARKRSQPIVSSPTTDDDLLSDYEHSPQQSLDLLNNQRYSEYTTEQLIDLIRQSVENYGLIAKELMRRCEGGSIGYLSPTHLSTLCEYYTAARLLDSDELLGLHARLQSQIQESNDANPLHILSASIDKLLHLTAIKLCLQNESVY